VCSHKSSRKRNDEQTFLANVTSLINNFVKFYKKVLAQFFQKKYDGQYTVIGFLKLHKFL